MSSEQLLWDIGHRSTTISQDRAQKDFAEVVHKELEALTASL